MIGRAGIRAERARLVGVVAAATLFATALAVPPAGAASRGGSGNPNGTLTVGYDFSSEFSNTFDPGLSQIECDSLITEQIYGFLLTRNAKDQIQPGLAQSWTVGQNSVTLNLRPGLTFSDGEPYDATAVMQGLLHSKSNSMFTELHMISSIDVLSPTSVRVNLNNNSGVRLIYALTQSAGEIPAPSTLSGNFSHPIGAGPFQFVSYQEGSQVVLKRNPTYWNNAAYHLGGVTFQQVGAGPPSVLALRAGSVDLVRLQPDVYSSVAGNPQFGTASRPSADYLQITFRFTGPFANTQVRQAFNLAINRQQINNVVLDGQGLVATQPFPPFSPIYVPGLVGSNTFNPAKAKRLLAQAGYPNGFGFTLLIPGGGITMEEQLATIVQANLARVGIRANVQRKLGSDLYTAYLIQKQGNALAAENTDNPYPPLILGAFTSSNFSANQLNAVSPTITGILAQADDSTSLPTIIKFGQAGNRVDVNQALEAPLAFVPQQVAWSKSAVGGTVQAPLTTCSPDNLAGITVKS